ncbi:MAG: glycosyltransferase family 39 protein [Bacteroidia bacterium]|nr:glycosyltransferase family 39 protein [Bacteroidia bacterium]
MVSFIWGFFYLLVGSKAYLCFALFQCVLDIFAAVIIFRIIRHYFNEKIGLWVVLMYGFFPLTTFFAAHTSAEYLSAFVVIVVFYKLVFFKPVLKHYILLGILLVFGFYVREILLLLIPLSVLYVWKNFGLNIKHNLITMLVMLVLYLPWPVRNYVNSGEVILLKPFSSGYPEFQEDMFSYMYWLYAWHDGDPDEYLEYSFRLDKPVKFPEEIFENEYEKKLAYNLVRLAQHCGASFIVWQRGAEWEHKQHNCNHTALISRGFNLLKNNYKTNHPVVYYIKVPLQNLKKAFFKSDLKNPQNVNGFLFVVAMIFRSLMLFIGLIACLVNWRIDYFKICFMFFAIIYFVICFILRQVEIRYLFQADVLMLIASMAYIGDIVNKRKLKIAIKQSPKLF